MVRRSCDGHGSEWPPSLWRWPTAALPAAAQETSTTTSLAPPTTSTPTTTSPPTTAPACHHAGDHRAPFHNRASLHNLDSTEHDVDHRRQHHDQRRVPTTIAIIVAAVAAIALIIGLIVLLTRRRRRSEWSTSARVVAADASVLASAVERGLPMLRDPNAAAQVWADLTGRGTRLRTQLRSARRRCHGGTGQTPRPSERPPLSRPCRRQSTRTDPFVSGRRHPPLSNSGTPRRFFASGQPSLSGPRQNSRRPNRRTDV